jgi:hypothetical protein
MIPSSSDIRKKLTTSTVQSIVLNTSDYFKLADEYVSLQKVFVRDTLFESLNIWMDMVIVPVLLLLKSLYMGSFDVMSLFTFQKTLTLWKDWFRFKELGNVLRKWVRVVRAIGGPFISANDAEYHVFVYADGMQRIFNSLLWHT